MKNTGSDPNYFASSTTADSAANTTLHITKLNIVLSEHKFMLVEQPVGLELSAREWKKYHRKIASL